MSKWNLEQPHPWRSYAKRGAIKLSYGHNESERTIIHLHTIEKKLRQEIRQEQVKFYTQEEIRRLYPDGRA